MISFDKIIKQLHHHIKTTETSFDCSSVRFACRRRRRRPSAIQLLQIIQNQLRPLLGNVIENQIALVVFENVLDFLHVSLIFAQRLQRLVCYQFGFLQKLFELSFRGDQFIFEVIFELPLALKSKRPRMISFCNQKKCENLTRSLEANFVYLGSSLMIFLISFHVLTSVTSTVSSSNSLKFWRFFFTNCSTCSLNNFSLSSLDKVSARSQR